MSNRTDKKAPDNRGNNEEKELEMLLRSIWLGRRDSNPRMPVPKTGALPLGHSPSSKRNCNVTCSVDKTSLLDTISNFTNAPFLEILVLNRKILTRVGVTQFRHEFYSKLLFSSMCLLCHTSS